MTISVVHTTTANSTSVTIPATTAGNCLVVCVCSFGTTGGQSVSGMTLGGSAGNFASLVSNAAGANTVFMWADPNCAGGQTAVVISGSGLTVDSSDGGIIVYEISGLASTIAGLLDKSASNDSAGGTSWSSGATALTTQASEIWIGCAATFNTATGPSSPWTNATPSGALSIAGYQIVSATGTATYAGTESSTGAWAAAVVALKAAAAAAGAPPVPLLIPPGFSSPMGFQHRAPRLPIVPADTEHGTATDTATIAVSDSDTGTGADTATAVQGAASTDTGTGTETSTVTATLAGTDSAAGADTATVTVAASDTGTGAESQAVTVLASDTAAAAESTSIAATLAGSDTGTGADAGKVRRPVSLWKAPDKLNKTGGTMS